MSFELIAHKYEYRYQDFLYYSAPIRTRNLTVITWRSSFTLRMFKMS